jgi:predicted nucleotidyltransferase
MMANKNIPHAKQLSTALRNRWLAFGRGVGDGATLLTALSMINIEEIKPLIVERLKPLNPDKIILFGSYAYGTQTEDSDIDLFLIKDDLAIENIRAYKLELQKKLFDIQKKYHLGIDLFVDSTQRMQDRIINIKDQFYDEILSRGEVIYGK